MAESCVIVHAVRHPKTIPHLNTILGDGWRLDHGPGLIAMNAGMSGHLLHGGAADAHPALPYVWAGGRIMTGLTVIEYLLADEGHGDGVWCLNSRSLMCGAATELVVCDCVHPSGRLHCSGQPQGKFEAPARSERVGEVQASCD